ncbi:MAG: hypothetical protein JST23_10620 [Bacteroidetes bacterium]|nr:hypothetical protein [Bacteroidota bacterium]
MYCRSLFTLLFAIATMLPTLAQDVSGIWKGYFVSEDGSYYKLEFQVAKNGSYSVQGVSYSYLDIRFYGKATMIGSYIKSSSNLRIKEIKTVEVKSTLGGATCIMNYNLAYSKSGKEEFLDGTYLGKYEDPYQDKQPGEWGDCGGGKVHLRKVSTSDFYVEPFLRNKVKKDVPVIVNQPPGHYEKNNSKPAITKKPPVNSNTPNKKTNPIVITRKPPVSKPPVAKNTPPKNPANNKPTVNKPIAGNKPSITKPTQIKPATPDEKKPVIVNNTPPEKTIDNNKKIEPITKVAPPPVIVPEVLKNRSNELVKVLTVNSPEVTIKLYDNGEIDGDIVSVYLDKKIVLDKKMLTASPLIVKFNLDEDDNVHELTLVAENLGRIPPNTSLMIVEAGKQRFDVQITSTEQKNAVVKFKYEKPK